MLEESHMYNGYWKFGTYDDDKRTHARGLDTPESVLLEQDRGDKSYDDIEIRWVPGLNDPYLRRPISGSAAQHLESIYEIRRIMGKPMSLRDQVPVYPNEPHAGLKQFWENKERMKQSVLPVDPALTSSRAPDPSPLGDGPSPEMQNPSRPESLPFDNTHSRNASVDYVVGNKQAANLKNPALLEHRSQHYMVPDRPNLSDQVGTGSNLVLRPGDRKMSQSTLLTRPMEVTPIVSQADPASTQCEQPDRSGVDPPADLDNDQTSRVHLKPNVYADSKRFSAVTQLPSQEMNSDLELPCMDCELHNGHTQDCHLGSTICCCNHADVN